MIKIIIATLILCYLFYNYTPTKIRFKYKTKLIYDDWTTERIYKLQVKFMGLIWITALDGSIDNEFKESEISEIKNKLETKKYYIKNFMLYIDTENEFII